MNRQAERTLPTFYPREIARLDATVAVVPTSRREPDDLPLPPDQEPQPPVREPAKPDKAPVDDPRPARPGKRVAAALLCLGTLFGAAPGFAEDPAPEQSTATLPPAWIAGIGYIRGGNPFVGDADGVSTVVPLIGYLGDRVTWLGPYFNYKWIDGSDASHGTTVNLTSSIRFQGFDDYDGDDPRLVGLVDRDAALEVGGSLERNGVKLALLADVSGQHDGYEVALSYGRDFKMNLRTQLSVSANLAWQSSNLIDYYYGVSPSESTAQREAYEGSAGTNIGVSADLRFFVTRQWMLLGRAGATALADDIVDSPLVEDDYEFSAMAGVIYRFGGRQ